MKAPGWWWRRQLRSKDAAARIDAASRLARPGDLASVAPLLAALLGDSNPAVRKEAARSLALIHPGWTTLDAAKPFRYQFEKGLWDGDDAHRAVCAAALKGIGDRASIVPLAVAAAYRPSFDEPRCPRATQAAQEALLGMNPPSQPLDWTGEQIAQLARYLESSKEETRRAAAVVCARVRRRELIAPLVAALMLGGVSVRREIETALAAVDPSWFSSPETRPLIPGLFAVDDLRKSIVVLERLEPAWRERPECQEMVDRRMAQLAGTDVRAAAAALGLARAGAAVEPMIRKLTGILEEWSRNRTGSYGQYAEAQAGALAIALGEIGHAAAAAVLLRMLSDPSAALRRAGAEALGKIADRGSVDGLITCLADGDREVAHRAVDALGRIGDARAVGPLSRLRELHHAAFTNSVVRALAAIGGVAAIRPLLEISIEADLCASEVGPALQAVDRQWFATAEAKEAIPWLRANAWRRWQEMGEDELSVFGQLDPSILDEIREPCHDSILAALAVISAALNRWAPKDGDWVLERWRHRAKGLGAVLNSRGGKPLMLEAFSDSGGARSLEMAWDGVGEWRG
jgi:HEAT repeat protein